MSTTTRTLFNSILLAYDLMLSSSSSYLVYLVHRKYDQGLGDWNVGYGMSYINVHPKVSPWIFYGPWPMVIYYAPILDGNEN